MTGNHWFLYNGGHLWANSWMQVESGRSIGRLIDLFIVFAVSFEFSSLEESLVMLCLWSSEVISFLCNWKQKILEKKLNTNKMPKKKIKNWFFQKLSPASAQFYDFSLSRLVWNIFNQAACFKLVSSQQREKTQHKIAPQATSLFLRSRCDTITGKTATGSWAVFFPLLFPWSPTQWRDDSRQKKASTRQGPWVETVPELKQWQAAQAKRLSNKEP